MTRPGRLLLLALAALFHSGCGGRDAPVAPALSAEGAFLVAPARGGPDLEDLATFDSPPSSTVRWAREWIGPEGGRLELGGFAIDVPAGAVSRVTPFSIRLPTDRFAAGRVVAEFGPHAARFAVPVAIELPYSGTSSETIGGSVLWWNPGSRDWVDMGSSLTADGLRLRAETDHFSLFGAGLPRSGGVTVSGG